MKDVLSKLAKIFGMLVIMCLLCYGVVVSFWLLYPYNVIDVDSIIIQNQGKVVKQGGTLIYEIKYTKFMDIVGTVHRQLVNTYTITYSDAVGMSPIGTMTTNTHLPVPVYATPGKYHLLWRVTHQVNPMRAITETVWSDEFEVIADPNIMKGEKGEAGEQGDTGKQGKQGLPGQPGQQGKKGSGFWPSSVIDLKKNNTHACSKSVPGG